MKLLALGLALCTTSPICGFRSKVRSRSVKAASAVDCSLLENVTLHNQNVGHSAALICQNWPAKFGDFPIASPGRLQEMAELAFPRGGLWEKIKEIARNRWLNKDFCWRSLKMREVQQDSNNCEVVSKGVCYGDCPNGFEDTKLLKHFRPVCKSTCTEDKKTPCGLGCAKSAVSCFKEVMGQVFAATRTVGMVASLITVNPVIYEVVDKVLKIVEFAINTLLRFVKIAKRIWDFFNRNEAIAALVTMLTTFILQHAEELGDNVEGVTVDVGKALEMWVEIVKSEWTWTKPDLEFISDTIGKQGIADWIPVVNIIKAFIYPKCRVA